jgi:hypothetical protein
MVSVPYYESSIPLPGIPGLQIPELPHPDLGILRHSRAANETVGEALKGSYLLGAENGFGLGYSFGHTAGHTTGFVEGCAVTAASSAVLFFVFVLLIFQLGKILR